MKEQKTALILLVAVSVVAVVTTLAVASVNYHSSRSNEPPSNGFVHDPVPCGGGGECLGGGPFGQPCTTNADCAGSMCAVRTPDTTSEGGLAACSSFQTFDELAGGLANGWHFGPKSKTRLKMKAKNGDIRVQLKLKDIQDAAGQPSNDGGQLALRLSQRNMDRIGGDMTLAPLTVSINIPLSKGKAKLKASLNEALAAMGLPSLPTSEIAITGARLIDPNGNRFGTIGVSLD